MLFLAHIIEAFYLLRELSIASTWSIIRLFGRLLPRIKGELVNLQPSMWNLTMVYPHTAYRRFALTPA
jgi:hypothetical protein